MLTAIIVDDESKSRKSLRQKLEEYCNGIEVIGEAVNGQEGFSKIMETSPDMVFLDIEMPVMNGLQLAENLNNYTGALIFTTAYNEYAINAFKYSAFDYLLKPVDIKELLDTIQRLNNKITKTLPPDNIVKQLQLLQQYLSGQREQIKKIAINTQEAVHLIDLSEIVRLEASSNYTNLYFADGKHLLASKTLGEFEQMLPDNNFFRVHHSSIINLKHVKRYLKSDGGSIEMSDGAFVDISRRKKEDFLEIIKHL
jgi:two-component system LytT family response regulator